MINIDLLKLIELFWNKTKWNYVALNNNPFYIYNILL